MEVWFHLGPADLCETTWLAGFIPGALATVCVARASEAIMVFGGFQLALVFLFRVRALFFFCFPLFLRLGVTGAFCKIQGMPLFSLSKQKVFAHVLLKKREWRGPTLLSLSIESVWSFPLKENRGGLPDSLLKQKVFEVLS